MRKITMIILHCSATPPSMDIGVDDIRPWHKRRGWRDIGYHFVIRRNGEVEDGRPVEQVGAHTRGYNVHSIGICMIGGMEEGNPSHAQDNFTPDQWASLKALLWAMKADYPGVTIHGHSEFAAKACPSFDVHHELREGRLKDV